MSKGEFSVYWFDPLGNSIPELRFVDSKIAVEKAADLIRRPAAKIDAIARIIITDGGDCTNFEWIHGKGITFPPEAAGFEPKPANG